MGYRLGVDLGTTFTAAAIDDGAGATVLALGDRALVAPSVVFLSPEGTFSCGQAAEDRAATDPSRASRDITGRIGDTAPVLLGGQPFSPQDLYAKLLSWTVSTATQRQGVAADDVVVTCPVTWGEHEHELLAQAISLAHVSSAVMCTDAEAAATHYSSRVQLSPGDKVAVYDLGGRTFEVSVLERHDDGFRVLGSPDGERFGGSDIDEAVFQHVLTQLRDQVSALDRRDPMVADFLTRLRRRCVDAKEALSSNPETTIPVSLPDLTTSVRLTRAEFEGLVVSRLRSTLETLQRVLHSANLTATELSTVVLVGGGARIPLVADLLRRELEVRTAMSEDPQLDVALGAVRYHPPTTGAGSASVARAAPTVPSWPTRGSASTDDHARPTPESTGDEEPVGATTPRAQDDAPAVSEPTLAEAAPLVLQSGSDEDDALADTADLDIPPPAPPPPYPQPQPPGRGPEGVPPISTVYGAGLPPPSGPSPTWSSGPTAPGGISRQVGWGLAALGVLVAVVVVAGVVYVMSHRGSTSVVDHDVILVPIATNDGDPVLHQVSTDPDRFGEDLGTVPGIPSGSQLLPSVSRSGHLLGYLWAPPGSGFAKLAGTPMEIAHGGQSESLFTRPPQGLHCHGRVAWSPDGSQVALACFDDLDGDGKDDNTHPGIYVFPVDSDGRVGGVPLGLWAKSPTSIIGGVSFTISGEVAAAYVDGPEPGLYAGKLGSTPVRLTSGDDEDPVSSPSDTLIAFTRDGDLYLAATDDTAALPCPAPRSPSTDDITHTRLCNLTGTTTSAESPASTPTWSWDGQTIAYRVEDPSTKTSTLWLIKVASGIPTPLITQPMTLGAPGWGPR